MKPSELVAEERGYFVSAGSDHGRENAHQECEHCGVIGAGRFGERWICDECIEGMSSCCPEFGKDDLWAENSRLSSLA